VKTLKNGYHEKTGEQLYSYQMFRIRPSDRGVQRFSEWRDTYNAEDGV